jgi:AAA+ ATPase superfamily predicted ATPase
MTINVDRAPLTEIVGRDALAAQVWQTLTEKSIVLTAERRMGKTYLLYKLWGEVEQNQQNWIQGWRCLYQDLSECSSPLQFVQRVLDEAQSLLGTWKKTLVQTSQFLRTFQELKVGPLQLPKSAVPEWKKILRSIFADLSQELPDDRVLFLWDEFPVMLDGIIQQEGGEVAAGEILNLLHTLRAEYPRIKMILTGSVGLHHVFSKLRASGYNNPVTNDMEVLSVPPLKMELAVELARSRLAQLSLSQEVDLDVMAAAIAREVDGIPFYIVEVIRRCQYHQLAIDAEAIRRMVRESLVDADNRWHMAHYLERIGNYYGVAQSEVVRSILDTVAAEGAIGTKEIIRFVKSANEAPIPDQLIRDLLKLLEQDHYLIKDPENLQYRFRYSLIQRYWQFQRS